MDHLRRQSIHNNIRLAALVLFAASLPFSVLLVNNIAIFLLGLNWLLESSFLTKWQRLKQKPLSFVLMQLFFVYALGLLYSDNFRQGMFEIEKKLGLLVFPLILSTSAPLRKDDLKKVFTSFIFFCTLATLICFSYAVYLNYKEGHTLSYVFNAVFFDKHLPDRYYYFNYWYFTYELFAKPIGMHPIYFAMYLVMTCCLSVWLWWQKAEGSRKTGILLALFLLYNFITIVLLSSRTQLFIVLLFGTGFILYGAYIKKKLWLGFTSVLLVYGLGMAFILLNPVARERFIESNNPKGHFSLNKYGQGGLSLRLYKWKYTWETIKQNPLLGTGTGDSQDELQKTYKKNDFTIGYDFKFNAHNQFLQVMLELGLAGLVSWLLCLYFPARLALKNRALIYLVFLALFTISCITESMLEVNKGIVFFAFFNALFAFHYIEHKAEDAV